MIISSFSLCTLQCYRLSSILCRLSNSLMLLVFGPPERSDTRNTVGQKVRLSQGMEALLQPGVEAERLKRREDSWAMEGALHDGLYR